MQSRYILLALLSALLMGTIGVFARFTALGAEQITFYRLFFGALFLLGYMLLTGKGQQVLHRPSKRHILNGAMLAGFMAFYVEAIGYTSMANVIMVIYLAPLLSAVIAHFTLGERLGPFNVLAILLALLGFMLMRPVEGVSLSPSLSPESDEARGLLFSGLALVSYTGFMLVNRRPSKASPYQSTLAQLSVGALCMLPLILQQAILQQTVMQQTVLPSMAQWLWLLAIGLLPGFLAILFAVKALQQLPAVTFGTLAYLEPVAVVGFAWWLFGETLSQVQLAGAGLIIAAGIGQGWLSQRKTTARGADLRVEC